jgi:hypothetical protein
MMLLTVSDLGSFYAETDYAFTIVDLKYENLVSNKIYESIARSN